MRPLSFARHLPFFGWQVTVLTPANAPSQSAADAAALAGLTTDVVATPFFDPLRIPRRIASRVHADRVASWLTFPDDAIGWLPGVLSAHDRLPRFDALLSSSPPPTAHLIAAHLQARTGVPWVADLRDPWADYHHEVLPRPDLRRWADRWLERTVLRRASRIVTISKPLASWMERIYERTVDVLPNGFEPDATIVHRPTPMGPLLVRYLGKVHPTFQDPKPFLVAVRRLLDDGRLGATDLTLEFYVVGAGRTYLESLISMLRLDVVARCLPIVPRSQALALTAEADVALVFDWAGEGDLARGVVPVKLYDALGTRTPILLANAHHGAARAIVEETGAGIVASNDNAMADAILELRRRKRAGHAFTVPESPGRSRYERSAIARDLASMLDAIS